MSSVFHKVLHKLVDHCPSSKRSIRDLRVQVSDLQARLDHMQYVLDEQLSHILENQHNMHVDTLTNREHASLLAWATYRRSDESDLDARKRFYYGLPQATGSVRLIQRGCASLLNEFAHIAKKHNLQYWADFGTLLGTVRHHGFIPWDDDTDLGMIRSDVNKLLELLKTDEELSKRYRAVLVFDPYVCCRQLRLRYKNPDDPSFIDIFFYDYMPEFNEKTKQRFIEIRQALQTDLHSKPFYKKWLENGYLEGGGGNLVAKSRLFLLSIAI
ncbi:LicD family protein [Fannyhessea vaginae]|uniref:LicD family protein n=1 Tax=Fannyhessea vaginae TaxID=82135 RepID=UPI003A805A09